MHHNFFYSFLLLMFSQHVIAQQATDLVVQTGHSAMINSMAYSNDGQKMVSNGMDKVIKVWDVKLGREFRSITTGYGSIANIATGHNPKAVIGMAEADSVKVWNIETGKQMHSMPMPDGIGFVYGLAAHPKASQVALGGLGIKVLEYTSGKLLWEIKDNTIVQCLDYSEDGSKLVSAGMSPEVKVLDASTGKEIKRFTPPSDGIPSTKTVFLKGNKVAVNTNTTVYIWDLNTGKLTYTTKGTTVYSFALSGDGKLLCVSKQVGNSAYLEITDLSSGQVIHTIPNVLGKTAFHLEGKLVACAQWGASGPIIRVLDVRSGLLAQELRGSFMMVNKLDFIQSDRIAVSGVTGVYDRNVKFWDLKQGNFWGFNSRNYSPIFDHAISKDGKLMALACVDSAIHVYQLPDAKKLYTFKCKKGWPNAVAISADNAYAAMGGYDNTVTLCNLKDGKTMRSLGTHSYFITAMAFSPDNKSLYSGSMDSVRVWNPITGKQENTFSAPIGLPVFHFMPRLNTLAVGDHQYLKLHTYPSGNLRFTLGTPVLPPNPVLSIASPRQKNIVASGYLNGQVVLWNSENGDSLKSLPGHTLQVKGLSFSEDDRYLASGSHDSKVKIWDYQAGREVATLISIDSANYVITTPDNYYKATREGLKGVSFRVGNKLYPFEQFDLQYNRPDIILERLGYADTALINSYKRAYEKRLKKMGFNEGMFNKEIHLPEVQLAGTGVPIKTNNPILPLKIIGDDSKYLLDRINVYVNDVPLYGRTGILVRDKQVKHLEQIENIALGTGRNKITVSVLNEKGVESLRENFEIVYEPAVLVKPDLYIIALGVSKYKNPQMNLSYASKDARDLVATFSRQKDQYNRIFVDTLFDRQATLENIMAMRQKLMKSKIDDRVVFFIAGHGLLDHNLDYYLATHDVDFLNPAQRGLPYDNLELLLDGIPSRNKILFIDACHSGEVDKEAVQLTTAKNTEEGEVAFRSFGNTAVKKVGLENSFELMKELFADVRKSSGTTVISSAGGAEYAMEGAQWNNGVFTYCLLSGLQDKKADINKDGQIMLSELQRFLQKRVAELTGGKQKPTSRMENLSNDLRVW